MALSIQRLRWVLLAGALLLVGVLAAYIGYGRYRAMNLYARLIQHSGAHITHDTNGFTYSQSVQGKTIFTLHAKKATQIGDGKWQLHDAAMTLYGRIPDRPDHIYGSEVEYDENDGVARAIGDVLMDLQAPNALTGNRADGAAADAQDAPDRIQDRIIHVKTSGLVYLRKLGVAATEQPVEFHYGGMECTAKGAEFNTGQNLLRLLADVKMDGATHDQPVHLTALHAEIDRTENVATLAHPVVTSGDRTGRSDSALLSFDSDGTIQRVQGFGNVALSEGTRQVSAARLDATLNDDMQLRAAHLSGGVGMVDTDPLRPMQGSASQVDAAFDAKGNPTSFTASGGAHVTSVDHRAGPRGLARAMEASQIVATFSTASKGKAKAKSEVREVHATGAAKATDESLAAPAKAAASAASGSKDGIKNTQVAADDLRITFAPSDDGKPQPKRLVGLGHTLLQQDAPGGEQQTSTGDTLDASFAAQAATDAMTISNAVQAGSVTMRSQVAAKATGERGAASSGTAQRAVYAGADALLTLTGDVHWRSDTGQIAAPTLSVNQHTQDAHAEGGVQATLQNEPSGPVTHILSASAELHHASQLSEFRGTDAQPAKMWQEASQVQAATLLFDGAKHTFSARPATAGTPIHAVLVGNPPAPKPGAKARAAAVIRVASPKMDYNDLQHEATFAGGVTLDGSMGEVKGERAAVFLSPAEKASTEQLKAPAVKAAASPTPFSGSLDRVVVLGDVRFNQPGRKATGDELLYTAASGNYVLTGTPAKPPVVVDAQQGSITGTTLLFGDAGSTIVVSGAPVAGKPGSRVRTETEVRP
jgi:lipopolysaccharide export system protein LptA